MGVKIDLTGKKFGKLTVIKEVPRPDNINGHDWSTKWECRCDCGNISIKTSTRLTKAENPKCKTCAEIESWESRINDLTGKVFGNLTVLRRVEKPNHLKKKTWYWECKCSCGNITIVSTSNLKTGHTFRCSECGYLESGKHKRKDLTGQIFDELTVLEMIYPKKSENKGTRCRCKCSCGNEIIVIFYIKLILIK